MNIAAAAAKRTAALIPERPVNTARCLPPYRTAPPQAMAKGRIISSSPAKWLLL
jgi:hypothetical protein